MFLSMFLLLILRTEKFVSYSYNCLLRIIIISYCVQTNEYYQIEIIAWNYIVISFRVEYLKQYSYAQIICIW